MKPYLALARSGFDKGHGKKPSKHWSVLSLRCGSVYLASQRKDSVDSEGDFRFQ